MKIEMPEVNVVKPKIDIKECVMYLVQENDTGDFSTVIVSNDRVIYFEGDTIVHSSLEYFEDEHKIIREYLPGETLKVTV